MNNSIDTCPVCQATAECSCSEEQVRAALANTVFGSIAALQNCSADVSRVTTLRRMISDAEQELVLIAIRNTELRHEDHHERGFRALAHVRALGITPPDSLVDMLKGLAHDNYELTQIKLNGE